MGAKERVKKEHLKLEKEKKQKASDKKKAEKMGKEVAVKKKKLIPKGSPLGLFKWDFAHPCDAGHGKFQQDVKYYAKVDVGTIPAGKLDVHINMDAKNDVDA